MLYCSAEIFTWKKYSYKDRIVLILYGNVGEIHEVAFKNVTFDNRAPYEFIEGGGGISAHRTDNIVILNWGVTLTRKIVRIGRNLHVHLLGIFRNFFLRASVLSQVLF